MELTRSLITALRIYGPTREMCVFNYESFTETEFHPNVAAKIVGLAFLSAVAAWEDFVEDIYLGYLCGYPSPNGYRPRLRFGPARNKPHALLLAAGESNPMEAARRLRWNNFRWVRDLSTVHFTADNVFRRVAVNDLDWLDLAQVVRNRIAHNSEKAKHQYKRALNKLVDGEPDAALPPGFAPGRFLIYPTKGGSRLEELALDDHFWGDVFEGYISLWERLANHLCPEAEAV